MAKNTACNIIAIKKTVLWKHLIWLLFNKKKGVIIPYRKALQNFIEINRLSSNIILHLHLNFYCLLYWCEKACIFMIWWKNNRVNIQKIFYVLSKYWIGFGFDWILYNTSIHFDLNLNSFKVHLIRTSTHTYNTKYLYICKPRIILNLQYKF